MRTSNNEFIPFIFVESLDVVFGHHFEETLLASKALGVGVVFFFLAEDGKINSEGGEDASRRGCRINAARMVGRIRTNIPKHIHFATEVFHHGDFHARILDPRVALALRLPKRIAAFGGVFERLL